MKNKLAINGGGKIVKYEAQAKFNWPIVDKKIEQAVIRQLYKTISIYNKSDIFEKFENLFCKYQKRKYALLFNSGTSAIHAMFVALNLKPGDEVICPVYTFYATVTPLLFTGAIPIFCDIDENGNINPYEIEKKITKKTKAVVITHMWGIPCQMDKILEICRKNRLVLLEDCSHAHGAEYKGKKLGSFGDLSAWSLQGQKILTGGEGGVLTTNNKEYYDRALLLGHYNKRCKQEISPDSPLYKFAVTGMGLKYRAHPLAVAIANEYLSRLDKWLAIKRIFAQRIIIRLKNYAAITLPQINNQKIKPSWYAFVFQYHENKTGVSINKFYQALKQEGLVEVDQPGSTCPLNLLPLFQKPAELFPIYRQYKFSYKKGEFPKAESFYNNAVKIPVWARVQDWPAMKLYIDGIEKVLININELK
ncbi:DegT/DnrJ/EryC1/StrS family aminotransferase [Patescibacteria group bacterium]|nr:DegT/DnrJ/EryC1/StrS family aminotransferase [Patescibacteria group bacterium]